MKRKAILVALLGFLALTALSVGNARAGTWYTCIITQAGANWTPSYVVTLTDTASTPAFTNTQFTIDPTSAQKKEIYAAALTALANSSNVSVFLNTITPGSKIYGITAIK